VVLLPVSSPFGLSRSRLGLELESDFDGTNQFTMSGLYTRGGMNAWGAEWRTLTRVGAVGQLQTEWHQPLGLASPWFVDGVLDYKGYEFTLYENFEPRTGAGVRTASASIALGRQIGDIGSFRLGARYRWGRGRLVSPGFDLDPFDLFLGADRSAFYELTLDTLDSLGYPSSGYLLSASGEYALRSGETDNRVYSSRYESLYAASYGDWSGHLYAAGIRTSADAYFQPLALGGFLRLSGAPLNSIFAEQVLLARTVVARRVGRLPVLAGGAVRIGFSLEAGRAKGGASVPDRSTFYGGSVFVQTETRVGPLYLALGSTRGAGTAVYLFLGPVLLPSGLVR
jgi:NTE family protein